MGRDCSEKCRAPTAQAGGVRIRRRRPGQGGPPGTIGRCAAAAILSGKQSIVSFLYPRAALAVAPATAISIRSKPFLTFQSSIHHEPFDEPPIILLIFSLRDRCN